MLWVFWLKGVFGKLPPKTILTVLILEKIGFLSNWALKKIIYTYCIQPNPYKKLHFIYKKNVF
jgi:hypothetical protein